MSIIDFLKNIFSITDYSETHKILRFLGIKLKYPKMVFLKKKNENPFYLYKKNNVDITTIPPAQGHTRTLQLANLALLVELDYVCKENNLKYWLDAGTLIGAIRHKGFIPWDDDIDTAMTRSDYNKIINAFEKSSRNPDIYAECTLDKRYNLLIKVRHRKCPQLFVDIFPFDLYGRTPNIKEQLVITKYIKSSRENIVRHFNPKTKMDEIDMEYSEFMNEILLTETAEDNDQTSYIWGVDYGHKWNNWFTASNVIFPLKTIEFEGYQFSCMNNPHAFLERVYGDYMAYPKKIGYGHFMYINMNKSANQIISDLSKSVKGK